MTSKRCKVPPYKRWVGPKVRKCGRKPLKGRIWGQVDATERADNWDWLKANRIEQC